MKSTKAEKQLPPVELAWSFAGRLYRVSCWPDIRFEVNAGSGWTECAPGEDVLIEGALCLERTTWKNYLTFVPQAERTFLEQFRFGRLAALQLISYCPGILPCLAETPALVAFLANHATLRGTPGPRWTEIAAIHERGGVYAILEWLGLPARATTLSALQNLIDPDVPRRLLEPLRSLLWQPSSVFVLQSTPAITDQKLARFCHALAA